MPIRSELFKKLALAGVSAALAGGLFFYRAETAHAASQVEAQRPAPTVSAGLRESYADVVDHVAPAVVTIRSARRVRAAQQFPFMEDPFFQQFFNNGNNNQQNRNRRQEAPYTLERALGSGVIVTADGYLLTNHHVIDGADQISVDLSDRRTFQAKVIGSDSPSDLALLKIEATGLPTLKLGDSDKVRVGDIALAVGNPLGLGETVTAGIISAKGRATGLSDGSFEDFLQTDAAINHGNSGGALVNIHGELIGINSQIVSPSGGNIGIGFAIPSNMARNVMDQLQHGGKVHRGRLGVGIQELTSDLAKSMGIENTHGVLVNSVDRDTPADRAGVHAGDIITAVDGNKVSDSNALRNRIAAMAPGTSVALTVLRDGQEQQLHAKLAELESDKEVAPSNGKGEPVHSQLGIGVEPLTPELADRLRVGRDVTGVAVMNVDPTGAAAEAGLQENDVISEVNHQPVKSAADIRSALAHLDGRPALLLVHRDGRSMFLAAKPR